MNLQYKYYSEYYKKIKGSNEKEIVNEKYTGITFKNDTDCSNSSVKILKDTLISCSKENSKIKTEDKHTEDDSENSKTKNIKYTELFLKTTYPGLIIGGGYVHEVPDCNDAFKLGFSLDYVTGMPYIPSSSVKGVLRAAFSNFDYMKEILGIEELAKELDKEEVRQKKIKDAEMNNKKIQVDHITEEDREKFICDKIRDYIFGPDGDDSCQGADTFLDAIVVTDKKDDKDNNDDAEGEEGNLKIFADDYITKHKGLKNPTPVKFLKIRPDVNFMFRFILCDSDIKFKLRKDTILEVESENNISSVTVTSKTKRDIFNQILLDFGIGARRNVGYGVLKETTMDKNNWSTVKYVGGKKNGSKITANK